MRLCDADELKQTFCAECDRSIKCEDCDIDYHFEHLAPTIDAVEVVRCKDCRFFHRYGFKLEYAECVNFDFYDTTEDGYCCWAERREDG